MPQVKGKEFSTPSPEAISPESFKRLLQISTRLSSTLQLDELLSLVMDVATELTDTQKASILLVDKQTGQLHFAASKGDEVPEGIVVPLDSSIAGWVVRHGRSVILSDVQSDSRFYAEVDSDESFVTRSMLAVPLITSKGVIGALEVLNKRDDAAYTAQDVALMEALASQSAVAILNAHLFHQSDLLAEIMHELKTPLMAISAASELLTRPELPADKHMELIYMVKQETVRLSKMTKDFLDFARLESGRVRLASEPVDVAGVINDVINITQPQAAERGISIVPELAQMLPMLGGPIQLLGDADRLKQVLLNLVSNAIKYNVENGRITLSAHLSDQTLHLSVRDMGPGISEEDMGHLFERFYRIPGSEKADGSGLGLSIANKIVEEHNGRIEVSSILGEGTTFTVILPVTAA
ncbi:MAG: GAF domain-containing sensor histidine kinase [Ardenticatenaceae bacterium]|nr:GAF domain-containing sensor histidine kinase [Ardenticatenaceae bacterium]